ncbi:uncharacterized protein [Nicotiana tomentosiformis]|uniref:uncharacterized protein n=1 Tax=Nicotiana tomentosiformis TaxID=4098 RepID=UPI00388C77DE
MANGESDEETELSVFHLKEKIKFLSKERLCELLLELTDESEDVNNKKEQLSKECVHALDTTILELRYENQKLKLGIGKKTDDRTQLTLETNVGKVKDELYKRDEQVQVKGSSQIWYMDSACSKHMTRSKNHFLSLENLKGGNVSFGNEKKGKIIGVGKVGKTDSHSIENVYLIDGVKYNLISVTPFFFTLNPL